MNLHMSNHDNLYYKGLAVLYMQQSITLLRANAWHGFLLVLWFDITHTNKDMFNTYRSQQTDTPLEIYSNTTCYVFTAAICITLNE